MANVKIIPADPHRTKSKACIEETPKLRVAAYCRVSTDTDEQATSYETQVEHYTEYISNNPKWTLAGIYADDGISGTNTKNRTEFNRMIEACMAGEIDMVISKSISRFARNTLDCLKYIRQLKAQNIPVYFDYHYGFPRPAGISVLKPECQARTSVPLPARQGTGEPQPLSGLHQGCGRQSHH